MSKRKINDILGIIQDFEPDGVGARSLKECLLIQINHHNFENEKLREIFKLLVSKYLNQLADQEYEKIATACNIEIAGVEQLHQFIKQNLNPNPGASFTSESSSHVVIPSFEVELDHYGQLKLTNLEKDKGLEITISKKYLEMLDDPNIDAETLSFIKNKIATAKDLIEQIKLRHQTLERIVNYIASKQLLFLKMGTPFLEPLLQKEIAESLNISSSTVSRLVSSKYIQTKHGIISLKQCCPSWLIW